jgi:hypothetical protein
MSGQFGLELFQSGQFGLELFHQGAFGQVIIMPKLTETETENTIMPHFHLLGLF